MDIKESIEKVVDKVKNDKEFKEKFKSAPIKALEDVLGVDLPDEQVKAVVEGVKAKVNLDKIGDVVEDVEEKMEGALGGLFHKKD